MFLQLAHTRTPIFSQTRILTLEIYRITKDFPPAERFAMVQQIRRATVSVHLNIAEGCSRKSLNERKRFFEIARGSLIEVDTALDLAKELQYKSEEKLNLVGRHVISTFKQLSGLMK